MPERYSITSNAEGIGKRFKVEVPERYAPRFNAAPGQLLPIITSSDPVGLSFFYWGTIPDWSKNRTISKKLLTLPLNQVLEKPSRLELLKTHRCLIPSDGYYEWKQIGKKTRIPHRFVMGNNETFSFAGIWEEFDDEKDKTHHIFRILTVPASDVSQNFNDEIPLIIKKDNEQLWLSEVTSEELIDILKENYKAVLNRYTVNPGIDDIKNDYPNLIKPYNAMDQHGNYSLFN